MKSDKDKKELQESDSEKELKVNTKILNYLDQNFPEEMDDREINIMAADVARKQVVKLVKVGIEEPESIMAFFAVTFDCIKEVLYNAKNKKVQKRGADEESFYIDFDMNVCGRFIIGFSDSDNTENEKIGSFTPHMYHLGDNLRRFEPDPGEEYSKVLASQWFAENVSEDRKFNKEIGTLASKRLAEEIGVHFNEGAPEVIVATFCICYDMIIAFLKEVFEKNYNEDDIETYELSVNVMNSFDAILRKDKDGNIKVGLKPSVSTKQETKNDGQATAINE